MDRLSRFRALRPSLAGLALAAALLPGCPSEVPSAAQFGADAAAAADTAGALDSSAGPDTAAGDATSGQLDAQQADAQQADAQQGDAPQADELQAETAQADAAGGDAGCAVNGCGPAPDCKTLTCQASGTCATSNASDGTGCGPDHTCYSGICTADLPKAIRVVAAGFVTCALLEGGTVACWGDGSHGQLGDGTANSGHYSAIPLTVPGVSGATDLSCGPSHCCAVVGGSVLCWGDNGYGGCDPTSSANNVLKPNAVPGVVGAVAVAGGGYHTCAIVVGGKVRCWGLGTAGQLGDGLANMPKTVVEATLGSAAAVQVGAGPNHTCVRTSKSTGLCWGYNENGELGDGNGGTSKEADLPVPISGLQGILALAVGEFHGCALVTGGGVRCWGHNASGALGTGGGNSYYSTPQTVAINTATAIAAGGEHTCAVVTGGGLWCWGDNASGQLGAAPGSILKYPAEVKAFGDAVEVAAGKTHTCARRSDGTVWCWGDNGLGQSGPLAGKSTAVPSQAY